MDFLTCTVVSVSLINDSDNASVIPTYNTCPKNDMTKAFVIIFTSERLWFIVKTKEASCHFLNPLNVTESIFLPTCEDQAESKFAVVS